MGDISLRNSALKFYPGAICRRNPESGLYQVECQGRVVGAGSIPARAWEDAYSAGRAEAQAKDLHAVPAGGWVKTL